MKSILCTVLIAGLLFISILTNASPAFSKRGASRPYVQSGAQGAYYARCVPAHSSGPQGTTTIYRSSAKETDADKVDVYPWYAAGRLVLGWSPIAGKVCVMAGKIEGTADVQPIPLSFYMGGKLLKAYSFEELEALGVPTHQLTPAGPMAELSFGDWEQIPGTNEYVFTVKTRGDRPLRFNILTGELYKENSP